MSYTRRTQESHAWTKEAARSHAWWPGIDSDIEKTARGCKQSFKTREALQAAPLFPWSRPTAPWQRILVDLATHKWSLIKKAGSDWSHKNHHRRSNSQCYAQRIARYGFPKQMLVKTAHHFSLLSTRNSLPEMVDILRPWLIVSGISFSKWRSRANTVWENVFPTIFEIILNFFLGIYQVERLIAKETGCRYTYFTSMNTCIRLFDQPRGFE